MSTPFIQSIQRIILPKYTIRIWRLEPDDYEHRVPGLNKIAITAHSNADLPMRELANLLLQQPDIDGVEVVDWDGHGMVLQRVELCERF